MDGLVGDRPGTGADRTEPPFCIRSPAAPEVSPLVETQVGDYDAFDLPSWQAALPQAEARLRVVDNDTEIDIIRQDYSPSAGDSPSSAQSELPAPQWQRVRKRRH